jgi:hypothetical protein
MVADDQVGAAVNAFHNAILDYRADGVLLRNSSMNLARACRISLGFIDASDPSARSNVPLAIALPASRSSTAVPSQALTGAFARVQHRSQRYPLGKAEAEAGGMKNPPG